MGRMTSPMSNRLYRQIKRINYAYNILAIVSVAKWRVVQNGQAEIKADKKLEKN
jgi:hypothetical protein